MHSRRSTKNINQQRRKQNKQWRKIFCWFSLKSLWILWEIVFDSVLDNTEIIAVVVFEFVVRKLSFTMHNWINIYFMFSMFHLLCWCCACDLKYTFTFSSRALKWENGCWRRTISNYFNWSQKKKIFLTKNIYVSIAAVRAHSLSLSTFLSTQKVFSITYMQTHFKLIEPQLFPLKFTYNIVEE